MEQTFICFPSVENSLLLTKTGEIERIVWRGWRVAAGGGGEQLQTKVPEDYAKISQSRRRPALLGPSPG